MILKKLEVFGFKSFADKTVFTFEPGITAFVGPNGCGKSNIVDALKWTLGEQSIKSLRGKEMADIIFNGNHGRKSLGYAEASVTFSNENALLPIDYTEVSITRRVYRSGEGEYFINKKPCRLKDIKELFMDTGIGADSYSIVEQGKVDILLQANAQERRVIFEEAAGISKYKAKKHEASLKLQRVQQNLLRLRDIIDEKQKRLRSINYQASKARRYKQKTQELREARIELTLHTYHKLTGQLTGLSEQVEKLILDKDGAAARSEQFDAEVTSLEARVIELDQQITRVESEKALVDSQIDGAEQQIRNNKERIQDLKEQGQRHAVNIADLSEKIVNARDEIEHLRDELTQSEKDTESLQEQLQTKSGEVEQKVGECRELAQSIEMKKNDFIQMLHNSSAVQNEIARLTAVHSSSENRRSRLATRAEEIRNQLDTLAAQKNDLEARRETFLRTVAEINEEIRQRRMEQEQADGEVTRLNDEMANLTQKRSAKESRRETLAALEARSDGVDTAVRTVIASAAEESSKLHGIKGLLANLIDVAPHHAIAIETAIGEYAQSILTDTEEQAVSALELVNSSDAGRVSFIPLDRVLRRSKPPLSPPNYPALIGHAADLVQCSESIRPAVENILANTFVVDNFDAAMELSNNGARDFRLVTLRGEVLEPSGPISGGRRKGQTGLISRKSELRSLDEEIAEIDDSIALLRTEQAIKRSHLDDLADALGGLQQKLIDVTNQRSSLDAELSRLEATGKSLNEELGVGRTEIEEADSLIQSIDKEIGERKAEIERLRQESEGIDVEVKRQESLRVEREKQRVALHEEVTQIKISLAETEQRQHNLHASVDNAEDSLREREETITRLEHDVESCRERQEHAQKEIGEKESLIRELMQRKEETHARTVSLINEREEVREKLETSREAVRQVKAEVAQFDERIHEARIKESEARLNMENLSDRMRDDYKLSVEEHYQGYIPEELDCEVKEQLIEELRGKIDRMGNVNLEAIDEQEQLELEASTLVSQEQDLLSAKEKLSEIIRKINRETKRRFEKTFNEIRENFQLVFRRLFGGGRADVFLEPDVDVLEAGVEIVACPPGKEPRSISLLSGGEKVMTAVALLFAVFKSKPSPFCMLDEVDAALDDNNIGRFVTMLQEFLESSQFIIVTHNKQTMAVADIMYGITMQESGVSKKISVNFEHSEEKVASEVA